MANKKKRKQLKAKTSEKKQWHPLSYEIVGILFIAYAIIIYFEYGVVGRWTQSIALFLFGNLHFVIPFLLVLSALIFMIKRKGVILKNRIVIGVLLIISGLAIFSHSLLFEELIQTKKLLSNSVLRETWRILIDHNGVQNRGHALGGGMSGALLFSILHVLFDATGAKIAAWVLLVIGTILVSGKTFFPFLIEKMPTLKSIWPQKRERVRKQKRTNTSEEYEISATNHNIHDEEPIISAFTQQPAVIENDNKLESAIQESEEEIIVQNATHMRYVLPSTQLLESPPPHDQSREYSVIQTNAKKLEQTLHSFGVKAKVVQVHLGPAVTKYEVLPDVGVKVSKIVSLQDDLALALAAKDIRLEAPIPGKSAIGIEVPNNDIAIVTLREVIEVPENKLASKLLISFGRDVTGQAMLAELNKMPHLLVAGATGSGKSVCINGIIISILMRATPQEVRMMMIDPKMVELNVYNGIPHLLAPVVTDARKAAQALQKIVSEMERRYDLFSHTGTRNIEGYNDYIEQHNKEKEEKQLKLPYIVVIVDELADLMMIASNEVEDAITRLAQMARAAGIHLIIATQRPSVDVITGIIKANIPSRIAFSVSSSVDSRTILDMGGAEKLLGRGDMLFLPAGASKPVRVQGAFVSDQEVEKVVDFVIQQQKAKYEEAMIVNESTVATVNDEKDDLYDEAISLIIEQQSASISMLQRRLRIGYARAARIVDQMEARGVVGPADGSRPRQVYTEKIMALQDA